MEKVLLDGLMEEFILGNTLKIKNKALEELNGQMVKFMKDIGEMDSKMGKEK